jgi:hypothetical protein
MVSAETVPGVAPADGTAVDAVDPPLNAINATATITADRPIITIPADPPVFLLAFAFAFLLT